MKTITKNEEHLGQYSSKNRAMTFCKSQIVSHRIILTTCYRCDESGFPVSRICWNTYLDRGFNDALNRAIGIN
jgi:hypothetical protein